MPELPVTHTNATRQASHESLDRRCRLASGRDGSGLAALYDRSDGVLEPTLGRRAITPAEAAAIIAEHWAPAVLSCPAEPPRVIRQRFRRLAPGP
ncbi:MAG TPA: hypothetical protein VGI44_16980 [Acidimicrobiales bacterium]